MMQNVLLLWHFSKLLTIPYFLIMLQYFHTPYLFIYFVTIPNLADGGKKKIDSTFS